MYIHLCVSKSKQSTKNQVQIRALSTSCKAYISRPPLRWQSEALNLFGKLFHSQGFSGGAVQGHGNPESILETGWYPIPSQLPPSFLSLPFWLGSKIADVYISLRRH